LGAFVIDPKMQGNPTMPISRMLAMDCFDFLFERLIFGG
jgi:hypothetical protein